MTARDELVEAARVAYLEAYEEEDARTALHSAEHSASGRQRAGITAALAVFEHAQQDAAEKFVRHLGADNGRSPGADELFARPSVFVDPNPVADERWANNLSYAATALEASADNGDRYCARLIREHLAAKSTAQNEPTAAQVENMRQVLNLADIDYSAREQRADAGGGEMDPGDWFAFLARAALRAMPPAVVEGELRD